MEQVPDPYELSTDAPGEPLCRLAGSAALHRPPAGGICSALPTTGWRGLQRFPANAQGQGAVCTVFTSRWPLQGCRVCRRLNLHYRVHKNNISENNTTRGCQNGAVPPCQASCGWRPEAANAAHRATLANSSRHKLKMLNYAGGQCWRGCHLLTGNNTPLAPRRKNTYQVLKNVGGMVGNSPKGRSHWSAWPPRLAC